MKNRVITIGFSTSRSWNPFSAIIRWWWNTEYSHVYLKWDTPWGFSEILEASGMSVKMKESERWNLKQKVIAEYPIEVAKEEFDMVMSTLRPLTGTPYGWKQVVGIAIAELFRLKANPFADGSRSLVCSELGLRFLLILGMAPTPIRKDRVSPKDIKNILDAGENS